MAYERTTIISWPVNNLSCSIGVTNSVVQAGRQFKKYWKIQWATLAYALQRLEEEFPGGEGEWTLDSPPSEIKPIQQGVGLVNLEVTGTRREPVQ